MKYIVCEEPNKFLLTEKDIPIKEDDQAFFIYSRMLGRELADKMLEIGDNLKKLKVGNSVIAIPYVYCTTNFEFLK